MSGFHIYFLSFLLLYAQVSFPQVSLSQQVLGCYGANVEFGNPVIMTTAGEAAIATLTTASYILTQGFHQPPGAGLIQFEVVTNDASCPSASDGSASVVGISGCQAPYNIVWSVGDSGPMVDRLLPGTYQVTVSSGSCKLTTDFTIGSGSEEFCRLQFFNAFSPNGDGTNDTWEIENIWRPEFADNEVEIFNRWGQVVWKGRGYNNAGVVWEGKSTKGESLPDATYFYLVRVGDTFFKGYVELTR